MRVYVYVCVYVFVCRVHQRGMLCNELSMYVYCVGLLCSELSIYVKCIGFAVLSMSVTHKPMFTFSMRKEEHDEECMTM